MRLQVVSKSTMTFGVAEHEAVDALLADAASLQVAESVVTETRVVEACRLCEHLFDGALFLDSRPVIVCDYNSSLEASKVRSRPSKLEP